METFYINTNSSDITMIGITDRDNPEDRLKEHNAKGNMDKWERHEWIDTHKHRELETHFLKQYASLSLHVEDPSQSKELFRMTPEQAVHIRDRFLGKSKKELNPFAVDLYRHIDDMDSKDIPKEDFKKNDEIKFGNFQIRFEKLDEAKINVLKDRVEVDGRIKKPIVLWVNDGISWVISGNHRLEVAKRLGMEIPTLRLPSYVDEECMREIAQLLNNHDPAIPTKNRDIKSRLIVDMNEHGVQYVEDNSKYYCDLYKKTTGGMGKLIKNAIKQRDEEDKISQGLFVYSDGMLKDAKESLRSKYKGCYVSLVNCRDIHGGMGKDFMHALKKKYSKVVFLLYSSSSGDYDQRESRTESFLENMDMLVKNTNLDYSHEVLKQSKESQWLI